MMDIGFNRGKFVRIDGTYNFGRPDHEHVDLLEEIIGSKMQSDEISEYLRLLNELILEHGATAIDMGKFTVSAGRINLEGFSHGFQWPNLNTQDGIEARKISDELFNLQHLK